MKLTIFLALYIIAGCFVLFLWALFKHVVYANLDGMKDEFGISIIIFWPFLLLYMILYMILLFLSRVAITSAEVLYLIIFNKRRYK